MDEVTMAKVVEAYIFHRKGVNVAIREPQSMRESMQLNHAYNTAVAWFKNHGSISIGWHR